ncbi:MAG: hypothetical protein LV477_11870 [Candidatus Nitrosotalea sp.]|nr:hypothetical protein [Candidatus Nitrosotalea sp.]
MKTRLAVLFICSILLFSLVAGVSSVDAHRSTHISQLIPANCKSVNGLPDSKCTPGAINLQVTQDNIKNTICKSGYTKTVRPPASYTESLKVKLMKSYGIKDSMKDYELDHLIPLEVGGNPTDVKNLWPEPRYGNNTASMKDSVENYLHEQVCSGNIKLGDAQKEIAINWYKYWMTMKN